MKKKDGFAKINVYGMMCEHCENAVKKAIFTIDGVTKVTASHQDNEVAVVFDPIKTSKEIFCKIIEQEGYFLTPASSSIEEELSGSLEEKFIGVKTQNIPIKEISFGIKGMHCANCALAVEKAFGKASGIVNSVINLPLEKAFVTYDPNIVNENEVFEIVKSAGYTPVESTGMSKSLPTIEKFRFFIAAGITIPMMIIMHSHVFSPVTTNYILFTLASIVQWVSGIAFYQGAYFSLKNKLANMDVLISLGISASYFYSVFSVFFLDPKIPVFFDSSAMLITFILLGKMLEAHAKGKTSHALRNLVELNPDTARIIRENGQKEIIPSNMISVGDQLQVLPGERIPVDGIIIKGISAIDESMITGESIPVNKNPGDFVTGATMNRSGVLVIEATRIGQDTFLAEIIRMVEDAQADKAPIQRFADKISNIFVPAVIIIAIGVFSIWYFYPDTQDNFLFAFERMVAVLVIACPCALGLATPTAIMAGSGLGLKNGILIKKGSALETISKLDILVFDKTGTLTKGNPQVTGIYPAKDKSEQELIQFAYAAAVNSSHPLATAITALAASRDILVKPTKNVIETSGEGISCTLDDKNIRAGKALSTDTIPEEISKIANQEASSGASLVYVFIDNEIAGLISLSDPVKPDAKQTIETLHKIGIKTALVSGDTQACVEFAAIQTRIGQIKAQVMPLEKISFVKELQKQGLIVGMVGDGINDAPALAQADVGIAIGSGTDVAKETGDLVLVKNTLIDVVKTIYLGKKTLSIIKGNFFWALFYNILMIPIAGGILYPGFGLFLPPELASIVMWISSLTVVSNSLRLYRIKL